MIQSEEETTGSRSSQFPFHTGPSMYQIVILPSVDFLQRKSKLPSPLRVAEPKVDNLLPASVRLTLALTLCQTFQQWLTAFGLGMACFHKTIKS
jgi:hypothetical protein